jgi:hypothetical protein
MGGAYGTNSKKNNFYRILVRNPEGKKPPERPRRRWVDNIKKDLERYNFGAMDLIGLDQDRDNWWTLVNAIINIRV